jgi:hypothetical protein
MVIQEAVYRLRGRSYPAPGEKDEACVKAALDKVTDQLH